MKPRGLRNNNPLNIRHSADNFQGEIKGDDKSFKTFSSMPYGYRAGFVLRIEQADRVIAGGTAVR